MSSNVTSFFELVADSSVFGEAFTQAAAKATTFAGQFKAAATSVEADAQRMQLAMVRAAGSPMASGLSATSPEFRAAENAAIMARLQSYGFPGGEAAASAQGAGSGLVMGGGISSLTSSLLIVGSLVAPLALVADNLLKATQSYAQMSAEVLRNSEAIGINAQQLQTWEKIASITGIDAQSMVMDFERFSKNLADGAVALKATGVTLADLGITSTNAGTAILQLSDYFHTHSDQAQKAAIATALFGRSGTELIPILDQGSQAFSSYEAELQKMGVLLSNSQLIVGAQAQVAIQNFSNAFEAAKDRLISSALPGFTVFFQFLSQLLENNGAVWNEIGTLISEDVSFIIGIISALTGVSVSLTTPATDASAAYQGLGAAIQDSSAAAGNSVGTTKAATDAITDQINTIQDLKRAYDDAADAQKAALQAQLDNLKDVTDTRRRSGEDIVTYERRLEELKLSDQIKGIDAAKTLYDRTADDQIAALERQKQAVSEAAGSMASSLAGGMTAGTNAMQATLDSASIKINQKFVDMGKTVGDKIRDWFKDPGKETLAAAEAFGQTLGGFIVVGAENQLKSQFLGWLLESPQAPPVNQHPQNPHTAAGGLFASPQDRLIAESGPEAVLPLTDRARSLALMESSGLAALARSAGSSSSQPTGLVVNIGTVNGADPTEVARMVRALQDEARRRGFALSGGIG